jgi:hypothetical protein
MSRIRWALPLALLTTLTLAIPAQAADPAYYIDTNNGRVADSSVAEDCSVSAAVDLHRGYSSTTDSTANAVSGHVRLSLGADTARVQVDNIRVGSVAAGFVDVNDLYPSARSTARNNTGATDWNGLVVNLYRNDNDSVSVDDPPYEAPYVADGLNSGFDFAPDVRTLRAYGDWISTTADLNPEVAGAQTLGSSVQVRAYGTARCGSGDLNRWTILSNATSTDA